MHLHLILPNWFIHQTVNVLQNKLLCQLGFCRKHASVTTNKIITVMQPASTKLANFKSSFWLCPTEWNKFMWCELSWRVMFLKIIRGIIWFWHIFITGLQCDSVCQMNYTPICPFCWFHPYLVDQPNISPCHLASSAMLHEMSSEKSTYPSIPISGYLCPSTI